MTNTLINENAREFILYETQNNETNKFQELKLIFNIKTKKKYKEIIDEHIIVDKNIRNGEAVLKNTRITVDDVSCILYETRGKKNQLEYIYEQYPSLTNKEQILAALLYSIKNTNIFLILLSIIFS